MDPEARRRACVEFRAKLSRDTGVDLTAAACEALLGHTFALSNGEEITVQGNPGRFYASLGSAIADHLAHALPDPLKIAWWCYREAAEVHTHPRGMGKLAACLFSGLGVTEDLAQAAVWFQKAADLGDADSQYSLGAMLLNGNARAGVAKDVVRGFALVRQAFAEGCIPALYHIALCHLNGVGVEKDAAHRVSLLRQVITQEVDVWKSDAERALAMCYAAGTGVEADTVQAALWCQRAADGGDEPAIELLPFIRTCGFCGTTPARKHCERCRQVRYCDVECHAAHWIDETDPHKSHCRRRAAEVTQWEAGGASTSAQ